MTTCPQCGAMTEDALRDCPACGAALTARRRVPWGAIGAGVFLALAAGVAVYVATRPEPIIQAVVPAEPTPAQALAPETVATAVPPPTAPADDVGRLNSAMQTCDAAAAADRDSLYLLIIPLQTEARHLDDWKTLAINRIGRAIVVSRDDMLAGLRAGTVALSDATYTVTMRDDLAPTQQRWERQSGVNQLSFADKGEIQAFRLQVTPTGQGETPDFGNRIARQLGECHWINLIPDP